MTRCRHCNRDVTLWRYFPCVTGKRHERWPDYRYAVDASGRMIRVN